MPGINAVMHVVLQHCADENPAELDAASEAYYDLWRANLRGEQPPDPLALLETVTDVVHGAVIAGAVTEIEAYETLSETLSWVLAIRSAGPPPLGARGYDRPHDLGYPLTMVYDQLGLRDDERCPGVAVLAYLDES